MSREDIAVKLDETAAEIKELSTQIRGSNVVNLVPIITSKGKLKGELHHLTIKQFTKFFGVAPKPVIVKEGKIPWHLALDQLATERGFKSDEELKEAIEKARDDVDRLADLKKEKRILLADLKTKVLAGVEVEKTKLEGDAPVFPKDETTKREVTEIDGVEVDARRNPSFWQLAVDYEATKEKPDKTLRVRFAKDRDKIVSAVVEDAKEAQKKEKLSPALQRKLKISGRRRGISPKIPKLR